MTSPVNRSFPGTFQTGQIVIILRGWDFLRSYKTSVPLQGLRGCCFSQLQWLRGSQFSRLSRNCGDVDGDRSLKATNPAVLIASQQFCLNKHSQNCCNPLVNFQSSKKVDFDIFFFCQNSHCFMERQDYGGPYSVILDISTSTV